MENEWVRLKLQYISRDLCNQKPQQGLKKFKYNDMQDFKYNVLVKNATQQKCNSNMFNLLYWITKEYKWTRVKLS